MQGAWLPLQSLAVKRKTFFVQILGGEKLLKNLLKSAGELFLSGLRGAKNVSNAFRIVFRISVFARFSNRFSYRLKSFSGAVSFCRHAALTNARKEAQAYASRRGQTYAARLHPHLLGSLIHPVCYALKKS